MLPINIVKVMVNHSQKYSQKILKMMMSSSISPEGGPFYSHHNDLWTL